MIRSRLGFSAFISAVIAASFCSAVDVAEAAPATEFVKRAGAHLKLHGAEFRFAGSNNYYLPYKSRFMVDDVLNAASAQGFNVMRVFGGLDIGNSDGSNSIAGKENGVYFQYWNGSAPAYNDGADGLEHMDYVIARAGELGIRLVIPFVNNWEATGGMDQYVRWRGGQYHDQFYTDPTIKQWYKNWILHVLNRTNSITGVRYKDDPTIMTWELGNEPRCKGSGDYPSSGTCTAATITAWADEMSRFIKKADNAHLVSVGDEGFYCTPGSGDWTENCNEGIDTIALTALPKIDVMSFHLYPDSWGKTVDWGTTWIERHFADALALDKPAMLGEFGLRDKSMRNPNYQVWTDAVMSSGGAGALYWILSGKQDNGTLYPDYDGFTVYCPSPVCSTLSHFGQMMTANQSLSFAPVADVDAAVTKFATPAVIRVLANDVAFGAAIVPSSVDLDPAAPGQQTTLSLAAGTFSVDAGGVVTFTPAPKFSGTVSASYAVSDVLGQSSNAASLSVEVEPNLNAAMLLASFETGTDGWGAASWDASAGTTSQTTAFHTDGNYGLRIDAARGSWFGAVFNAGIDISAKTVLKWDVRTLVGTSQELAIQSGNGWTWCQDTRWPWVNANTSTTMEVDLRKLNCAADLKSVRSVYIFLGNGGAGTVYIDNVRAE